MHPPRALSVLTLVTGVFLSACSSSRDGGHAPVRTTSSAKALGSVGSSADGETRGAASAHLSASAAPPTEVSSGDRERGSSLVVSFECNRCHDGTGHPAMATEKHCTHCHEDIETGRFGAGSAKIAEWRRSVGPYRYAPSLEGAGKRFRPEWLVRFLQNPEDLRPHLAATMPRLGITAQQATDLAAYLTRDAALPDPGHLDTSTASGGSLERGRALLEAKGCGGCHAFTGAPPLPTVPTVATGTDAQKKAVQLAPDLRLARERFRPDALVSWLLAPSSLKADTPMPSHSLTGQEASDLAAYLMRVELRPATKTPLPPRLPVLSRRVTYREVETRVLSITCRHCHGNPDVAGGDGGPGNTGGFGFLPRGLDLSTYRSAAAGLMREDGQRHSLFERGTDGTPMLVAALRARQCEEAGQPVAGVRGMPLGLPAISAEDLQLVETWVAEGRPL